MRTSPSGFKRFRNDDLIEKAVGPIGEVKEYRLPPEEMEKYNTDKYTPKDRWGQPIKRPIVGNDWSKGPGGDAS